MSIYEILSLVYIFGMGALEVMTVKKQVGKKKIVNHCDKPAEWYIPAVLHQGALLLFVYEDMYRTPFIVFVIGIILYAILSEKNRPLTVKGWMWFIAISLYLSPIVGYILRRMDNWTCDPNYQSGR